MAGGWTRDGAVNEQIDASIEDVACLKTEVGSYAVLADLPGVKLDALRPASSVPPSSILATIRDHIALKYPGPIQFIPLFLPLRPFPRLSRGLVSLLSGESADVGGYCSQMISQILRNLYGVSVGGPDDHISPGMLRRRLLRSGRATQVDCFTVEPPENGKQSAQLQEIYRNLLNVTSKLRAYQYPHNRASFEHALANTFKEEGISDDPKKFEAPVASLRRILTNTEFFRLHELVWANKYT